MIRILIITLLAFSSALQAQTDTLNRLDSSGRKSGYWIYSGSTGQKQYEGYFLDGHPVGKFTRYHPDGKVSAYLDYDSTGTHVMARFFDSEGILRATGLYLNQRKEGLWEFFSSAKTPLYRIFYQNGLINGDAWRYDIDGRPVEKTVWKNNVLEGIQITFHPEGPVQAKMSYRNGIADGLFEVLLPDGKTEISGQYSEGTKSGRWTYYKGNGSVDYILSFRKGKLLNPEVLSRIQRESFEQYEKNQGLLRDPADFLNNPEELIKR